MKKKLRVASVIFLAITIAACAKKSSDESDDIKTTAKVAVEAAVVTTGNIPMQITVTGHTEATQEEKIVAPIAGKLLSLNGFEGSFVKTGEVIATIQSKEAESSEEGARVMASEAKNSREREQVKRTLELAKDAQNGVTVRASISGLIATRSSNAGEFVAENQELLSIVSMNDIVFVADVPLLDMPHVRIGEAAQVVLPTAGSSTIAATVIAIKPAADSTSQSAHVIFQFRSVPDALVRALRTGIAGTATIIFDVRHGAMLVPKSAVLRNDETNEKTVVTFGLDSMAKSIEVTTGPEIDSMVEVESADLKPGMNVVVVGNYSLADSTRITLVNAAPSEDKNS
ncbi:MAG TPA: efflux RND transporter periplasmic adaptor subunit, partial [Candidatus Kapabacteria bacterium]